MLEIKFLNRSISDWASLSLASRSGLGSITCSEMTGAAAGAGAGGGGVGGWGVCTFTFTTAGGV